MQDTCNLKEFAERHTIPYRTVRNRASADDWTKKRKHARDTIGTLARQKHIERNAESLASQIEQSNAADLEIAALLREHIRDQLESPKGKFLPPQDIRTLALSSKTAQDIARTALGADNPDVSDGADQVWEVCFLSDDGDDVAED